MNVVNYSDYQLLISAKLYAKNCYLINHMDIRFYVAVGYFVIHVIENDDKKYSFENMAVLSTSPYSHCLHDGGRINCLIISFIFLDS